MKNKTRKQNETKQIKKTGSVLVFVIFLLLISLIIGTGLMMLGTQSRTEAIKKVRGVMARSAADAGLEFAVQEINNAVSNGTWSSSVLPVAAGVELFGSGSTYSVTSKYDAATGYTIQSTGTNSDRIRNITATLKLKGLYDMGIQCRKTMILKSGTVVDAIDSSISLNPDDTEQKAVLGTNSIEAGSIILNNGVKVDGDVVVGVGGDVTTAIKDLGATTGDRYTLTAEVDFPPVEPPLLIGPDTQIEVKTGEKTIGAGGDYPAVGRFSGIKLRWNTVIRVIDDCVLYITGDVDLGQSSEIIIDSDKGASLVIYLDGDWIADNNSGIINKPENTSDFQLYATGVVGQIIDMKAKGDFYGSIYAPDSTLTVFASGDVYGAFVADSFEFKSSGRFYYDAALQNVTVNDEGSRFVISRWNEQ